MEVALLMAAVASGMWTLWVGCWTATRVPDPEFPEKLRLAALSPVQAVPFVHGAAALSTFFAAVWSVAVTSSGSTPNKTAIMALVIGWPSLWALFGLAAVLR